MGSRGLTDFPYGPDYLELDGLRTHHIDEGPEIAWLPYCCMVSRLGDTFVGR